MKDGYRLLINLIPTVERAPTLSAKHAKHTDRSVRAGRSQLLSGYPSLYVLIHDCQDIARQVLVLSDIGKTILTSSPIWSKSSHTGALPQDIPTGTILGSAWGLLVVLFNGYVMNRIGFTKSNWKEQPSYLDLPLLGESKLT
jgi:hypothetical protein